MKKKKIELNYNEAQKISNALLCLRQKYVELYHLTVIDTSSSVNDSIIKEVEIIDNIILKINNIIEKFEN